MVFPLDQLLSILGLILTLWAAIAMTRGVITDLSIVCERVDALGRFDFQFSEAEKHLLEDWLKQALGMRCGLILIVTGIVCQVAAISVTLTPKKMLVPIEVAVVLILGSFVVPLILLFWKLPRQVDARVRNYYHAILERSSERSKDHYKRRFREWFGDEENQDYSSVN